jgi:hypothetical protein
MKIDWKKEISLPKLRRPSLPSRSSKAPLNASAPKGRRSTPKLSRPSLGGPELQMPKFATDLYADLRDRHLLPLVALLIVAIIAAPILLSGSGGEEPAAVTPAGVEGETKTAGLTVVPAEDGLRDYKRRLAHRTPLNPFRRPPESEASQSASSSGSTQGSSAGSGSEGSETAASAEPSSASGQEVSTTTVGGVTTETVEPSSSGSSGVKTHKHHQQHKSGQSESSRSKSGGKESSAASEAKEASSPESTTPSTPEASESTKSAEPTHTPANNGGTSESSTAKGVSTVVGYTIDAEAGFVPKAHEKRGIAPMTKLPNKKHPVVLYVGLSKNHKRALFLMTSNVTAYYGGHCALDKQACQLVEVGPGKGVTFAVGYGKTRYKLHLKSIVPVVKHAH